MRTHENGHPDLDIDWQCTANLQFVLRDNLLNEYHTVLRILLIHCK